MERKSNDDNDGDDSEMATDAKFRPFKSNIKSKHLPPPAAVFAKAGDDDDDDEEDDYMSNDILKEIGDVRPGLVWSKSTQRKYECEERVKKKNEENRAKAVACSSKVLEKVNREEGLKKSALDPSNVGFKLMQKMGFKPGEALGSTTSASKRLLEPISIAEIKADREGLGKTEERKNKLAEIRELTKRYHELRHLSEAQVTRTYLEHKRIRFQVRKLVHNLHKCQRVCHELDSTNDLKAPEVKWYWPLTVRRHMKLKTSEVAKPEKKTEEKPKTADHKEQTEPNEPNEMVRDDQKKLEVREENKPLKDVNIRKVYEERLNDFINEPDRAADDVAKPSTSVQPLVVNYEDEEENDDCSSDDVDSKERKYFREQFEKEKVKSDSEDLSDKEAGRATAAKKRAIPNIESDEEDEEEDLNDQNEQIIANKVDAICLYLRDRYFYCVWCSVSYENEAGMNEACPGLREDDHED